MGLTSSIAENMTASLDKENVRDIALIHYRRGTGLNTVSPDQVLGHLMREFCQVRTGITGVVPAWKETFSCTEKEADSAGEKTPQRGAPRLHKKRPEWANPHRLRANRSAGTPPRRTRRLQLRPGTAWSGTEMDKLREMEVFVAIVDRGSFTGAAEKLGMSTSAVSRALNSLEVRLGAQLLARTTRSVRPTDAGMSYLDACRSVLDTIMDAEASVAADHDNPVGTLTISAPVLFGQRFIAPLVNAYTRRYPDVTVNAVYVDRTTRLLEEGVDIAIRIGHLGDSSIFAVPLGFMRRCTYAAPGYLAVHGEPHHPRDLASHHCVSYTGVTHPLEWVFYENGSRLPVRLQPRMIVDLAPAAVVAATDCVGITQLLSYQAAPEVLDGSLQPLLTAFEPEAIPVSLLHVERRSESGKVRAFVEFVTETLRRNVHLQYASREMTGDVLARITDE
jgi:DNA-binding transcriptional LysR family regulator